MPTYEYHCDACQHDFEAFQSMSAAPIKKCPKCGKNKVKRLIGAGAGLIFKGSGFYITDYRDSGYQEKAKADSGQSSSSDSKGSGDAAASSTESKPAAEAKPAAKSDTPAASKPSSSSSSSKPSSGGKKKSK